MSLLQALAALPSSLGQLPPATWPVFAVHAKAEAIAKLVPHGRVLTLAPLFPLEAGCEIYPEFATGPFAWRTAPFIAPAERQIYDFVGPAELESYLAGDPPAAILTGFEHANWEEPLLSYAGRHHYVGHRLPGRGVVWLPASQAPSAIRSRTTLREEKLISRDGAAAIDRLNFPESSQAWEAGGE